MYSFEIDNLCGTQTDSHTLEGAAAFDVYNTLNGGSSLSGASNYSALPSCSGDLL